MSYTNTATAWRYLQQSRFVPHQKTQVRSGITGLCWKLLERSSVFALSPNGLVLQIQLKAIQHPVKMHWETDSFWKVSYSNRQARERIWQGSLLVSFSMGGKVKAYLNGGEVVTHRNSPWKLQKKLKSSVFIYQVLTGGGGKFVSLLACF